MDASGARGDTARVQPSVAVDAPRAVHHTPGHHAPFDDASIHTTGHHTTGHHTTGHHTTGDHLAVFLVGLLLAIHLGGPATWPASSRAVTGRPGDSAEHLSFGEVIAIMAGPSGSGKTTIGALLAGRLHWTFADADSFHPPANIAKMRSGTPLTDADRRPWLRAIAQWMDERIAAGEQAVVTCSALKRAYRDVLLRDRPQVRLVFLNLPRDVLESRLAGRHGHFFPKQLLDSQLADLELPGPDEHALVLTPEGPPTETVTAIIEELQATAAPPPGSAQGGRRRHR